MTAQLVELFLPEVGVGDEAAVGQIPKPLGDGEQRDVLVEAGQDVIGEPVDAEAGDAADDHISAAECLLELFDLVVLDAGGEVGVELRVPTRSAAGVDDLAVERCTDKADGVAVFPRRERQRRAHHAGADDSYC